MMPNGAMGMAGPGMHDVPWPNAAASFIAMWTAMMVAMMLPSLWPTLWRYRRALDAIGVSRSTLETTRFGIGYMGVWVAIGMIVFAVDAALAAVAMRWSTFAPITPLATGVVIVIAGALQLTRWKAHHLTQARGAFLERGTLSPRNVSAWRAGIRLGMHCAISCAGATATLLVVGVMDLRAMAVLTALITAERILPGGARVARATGAIALGAGVLLLARASGVA